MQPEERAGKQTHGNYRIVSFTFQLSKQIGEH